MKFARLLGALAACSVFACAGIISGTVIDATINEPVRKAVVTLTWQGTPRSWATSQTDSSGTFRFEGLPAGKFDLRAVKTNEGTAVYGASSAHELGDLISLEDGETKTGINLRFLHTATITGRVLDPEGDPAPGVTVSLLQPGRTVGEHQATIDDRGEFRFIGIAPGHYYVHASQIPEMAGDRPLTQQFLGGAREAKKSTILKVRSGDHLTGIDFHMISEPKVQLQGRVTGVPPDADGIRLFTGPAEEVMELLYEVPITVKPPDYAFIVNLNSGRYRVNASLQIGGKILSASQIVDTRQPPAELVIALEPARDIRGRLQIEGPGGPPPVSFHIQLSQGRGQQHFSVSPGADGTFTVPMVPSGAWELSVDPLPSGVYLKSAVLGDSISVVVSTRTAQIHGKTETRAGVLLVPAGNTPYYDVATDDDGAFELKGIAPGRYKIYALEKMNAADFESPEIAALLDAFAEVIDLTENATLEVQPKFIPIERAREALP